MKLLLADDHTLFRDALVQYIVRSDPGADVTLAKDLPETLEMIRKKPDQDLVLLDLRMPGMNGMEGFKTVRIRYPSLRVAIMSGVAENDDISNAIDLGAVGYFPKTLSGKALLRGIQQVLAGEKFIPYDNAGFVMPSYYGDSAPARATPERQPSGYFQLTAREKEVLAQLLLGKTNKEIALALGIQVVTVKLHIRGICRKLEVSNRTQAALKAKEMGVPV